jgi:uncharacterized cupin superfamily protein
MPRIDVASVFARRGSGYPSPFDAPCATRMRQRLGDAGGLEDFGVNLLRLPPGAWSSQRHWHSYEEEFVWVLEGEVTLVEDQGRTLLRAGQCAAFPKGTGNGHHLINESSAMAVYLEVGSRHADDLTTCSDIDLKSGNADGRFVRKDGTPYNWTPIALTPDWGTPRIQDTARIRDTHLLAHLIGRVAPGHPSVQFAIDGCPISGRV